MLDFPMNPHVRPLLVGWLVLGFTGLIMNLIYLFNLLSNVE